MKIWIVLGGYHYTEWRNGWEGDYSIDWNNDWIVRCFISSDAAKRFGAACEQQRTEIFADVIEKSGPHSTNTEQDSIFHNWLDSANECGQPHRSNLLDPALTSWQRVFHTAYSVEEAELDEVGD